MSDRQYVAIDLKSFYASVECVELNRDPLDTNLVVADKSRTEKTICLAVSPSLKSYGLPGRARLFEVNEKVRQINRERKRNCPIHNFTGSSDSFSELKKDPTLSLDFIIAKPRMALYMEYSTRIYNIYLKYIAPEDIHVYSIDEVFMDVTSYLKTYHMTAHELAMTMIHDVLNTTGITATAGIGTNLYLCKIAMDIVAKHIPADKDGVRIAELDEYTYRKELWSHKPITDFWRVGKGYAKRLEEANILTMGDIARCSLGGRNDYKNEELLYKMFGINAELLIDHAWGWEPCTIKDIKAYKPETNSLGSGQVLSHPYSFEKAKIVIREMAESLSLDLVDKGLVTKQLVITINYDSENISETYKGETTTDFYGRSVPKHSHGTIGLSGYTSSSKKITDAAVSLFQQIANEKLTVRRLNITAANVILESNVIVENEYEQISFFAKPEKQSQEDPVDTEREKRMQQAILKIKKQFGKNSILKGTDLEEGATAIERNTQIGGHKA